MSIAAPTPFFPFGSGSRRCLGAAFANYPMKIVIAQILLRVKSQETEGCAAKATRRGIAFAPAKGCPLSRSNVPQKTAMAQVLSVEPATRRSVPQD